LSICFCKNTFRLTDALLARYAPAAHVEWKQPIGKYEAEFNVGKNRPESKFDGKGNWLESLKFLSKGRLPLDLSKNIRKSKYGHWKIKSSPEIFLPNARSECQITVTRGDFAMRNLKIDPS